MGLSLCWYSRITAKIEDYNKRFNYRRSLDTEEIHKSPLEIFKDCIESHKAYKFEKLRACIEFDESVSAEQRKYCLDSLRSLADESEVIENRPSNVDEWLEEALYVSRYFGEDKSILFHYNHDHFFVADKINEEFVNEIVKINTQIPNSVIMSTDFPIWNCRTNSFFVRNAHKKYVGPVETVSISGSYTGLIWTRLDDMWGGGHGLGINQHGECICSAKMHLQLWLSLTREQENIKLKYVARPDWHGVVETGIKASFIIPPSEICTHYDGYGYLTSLTQYISPLTIKQGKWCFTREGKVVIREKLISHKDLNQFRRENYILISNI